MNEEYNEYRVNAGDALFTFFTHTGVENKSKESTHLHTHRFHELICMLKGEGEVGTEESSFILKEGDAVLIPVDANHYTSINENSKRLAIPFFCEKASDSSFKIYDSFKGSDVAVFKDFIGIQAVKRFLDYYESGYKDKDELMCACLHELIVLIKMSKEKNERLFVSENTVNDKNKRKYIIDRYLNQQYKNASLKQLSDLLYLSPQQTQRVIKQLYSKTFREHINSVKMKNGKRLLMTTNLSVARIAEEIGYSNAHNFISNFKKRYNETPKQYKIKFSGK